MKIPSAQNLNLDAMPHSELVEFAIAVGGGTACGHPSIKAARALFPDRPKGYVVATGDLRAYAWNKATAMQCRLRGEIETALIYEGIGDRIYDRLPDWARW